VSGRLRTGFSILQGYRAGTDCRWLAGSCLTR
jgi:hypothetical protein